MALALSAATTSAGKSMEQQTHLQRRLKPEADTFNVIQEATCTCKDTPRPCLWINGEGNRKGKKDLQFYSDYFRDMYEHSACCSSHKYASLDTVSVGWTDETLQEKVCSYALSMSGSSDVKEKVIKDTMLVTHSMGALIVAGAVANKKCSIDKSTLWVSMSAPMNGTMASDSLQDSCKDQDTQPFNKVLSIVGKCPVSAGMRSLAYFDGKHSTAALNKAYLAAQEVYRDHVSAVMCSDSYSGIFSVDMFKYLALSSYIDHGTTEHDGIVTYKSCRGGFSASKFEDKPSALFYVSECNHRDTTFRHGDGVLGDKDPVKWFQCLFTDEREEEEEEESNSLNKV